MFYIRALNDNSIHTKNNKYTYVNCI